MDSILPLLLASGVVIAAFFGLKKKPENNVPPSPPPTDLNVTPIFNNGTLLDRIIGKETFTSTSGARGIRNNNPGNIRKSNDKWQGLSAVQTDSAFFQFDAPKWGIRALVKVLLTYQNKYALTTVRGIISRWAPSVENNTAAYISSVAKSMGVKADDRLNLNNYNTMLALVKAIIYHENGEQPYSSAQLKEGINLAGVV